MEEKNYFMEHGLYVRIRRVPDGCVYFSGSVARELFRCTHFYLGMDEFFTALNHLHQSSASPLTSIHK